jgi:ribA/ribD-fused uncharacterized protein
MQHKPIVRFDKENYYLSNFFPAQLNIRNRTTDTVYTFETNEAAFQAAKWSAMLDQSSEAIGAYIRKCSDTHSATLVKRAGRSVKIDVDKWDAMKVYAMSDLVWTKFLQHEDLRQKLIDTGASLLVEGNDWGDVFWGRVDGRGLNVLGSILMNVRGYWQIRQWREDNNI